MQTENRLRQTAFATAALADDCDSLPALQLKAHPVHGAHEPGAPENPTPELKLRKQISDGEKGSLLRSGFHSSRFQRSAIFFENGVLRIEDRDLQSSIFNPRSSILHLQSSSSLLVQPTLYLPSVFRRD